MRQLDESLRRLRTDFSTSGRFTSACITTIPSTTSRPDGVVEALARAKTQGKVRFVGFTGHKDPEIHLRMLASGFDFDACQLPLNGLDATFRSFQTRVLPDGRAAESPRSA